MPALVLKNLVFDILTEVRASELSDFERLFVVENCECQKHEGWLSDLFLACGCFGEARRLAEKYDDKRTLGNLAWAEGDLAAAGQYYSATGPCPTAPRREKSWDRLIKLAFFRGDWSRVISLVLDAPISPGFSKGHIVMCSSDTAGGTYLKMVSAALAKNTGMIGSHTFDALSQKFGIPAAEIQRVVAAASVSVDKQIEKSRKLCPPRIAKVPPMSLAAACERGSTPRAKGLITFLSMAGDLAVAARRSLHSFVETGDEAELKSFLRIVIQPGVVSVSHSFLFTVFGHDGYDPKDVPAERLIRLYSCHSVMDKRYFGRLLHFKFISKARLTAQDVLTGIFQKFGAFPAEATISALTAKRTLDFDRLISCRDWAEMRLQDWLSGPGEALEQNAAQAWQNGTPEKVSGPFGHRNGRPDSPRSMAEWARLVDSALDWLEERWVAEIGISQWQSETELFELLKKAFKDYQVDRHAQPIWLAPQHLDIFVPALSLAVEYMGKQHYEPVEFFGGSAGFEKNVERDRRKVEICQKAQITLEYVRFDEDLGARVAEIACKASGATPVG